MENNRTCNEITILQQNYKELERSVATKELEYLREKVKALEMENKLLRKERDAAYELANLLKVAKNMVDDLKVCLNTNNTNNVSTNNLNMSALCKSNYSNSSSSIASSDEPDFHAHKKIKPDPEMDTSISSLQNRSVDSIDIDMIGDMEMPHCYQTNGETQGETEHPQLQWKSTDREVTKLTNYHEIYLPVMVLQKTLSVCNTGSQMIRHLARAIFTENALATCSVFGGASKGPLGKQTEIRAPLHSEAVSAILSFVLEHGRNKNWTEQRRDLVHTLGTLLSTARSKCKRVEM